MEMAIQNGQVVIDVTARIQAMQSSVNQLQKVLDGLEPNTKSFKQLQTIIGSMEKGIARVQTQTSKGFVSDAQFKQVNKTIDTMEDSLINASNVISRINFKDLKIDASQQATLESFKEQMQAITNEFENFKKQVNQGVVQKADADFLQTALPTASVNTLEQNMKALKTYIGQRADAIDKVRRQQELLQNTIAAGDLAKNIQTDGLAALPTDIFQQYFKTLSNGKIQWQTGIGDNLKAQFFEYLQNSLSLTDQDVQKMQKFTAPQIQKFLQSYDFGKLIEESGAAKEQSSQLELKMAPDVSRLAQALNLYTQFQDAQREIAVEEANVKAKTDEVTASQVQYQNALAQNYRGSNDFSQSQERLSQELQGLKQDLAGVNAEFTKVQQQRQAFNSIQMAITNFMGFNQVMNLTKRAVSEAANHIKELDQVMTNIAIVTDMSQRDLWGQIDTYSKLAQTYGTSIKGAYEVSQIYYQQGGQVFDFFPKL